MGGSGCRAQGPVPSPHTRAQTPARTQAAPVLRAAAGRRADAGLAGDDALGGDADGGVGGLLHLPVQLGPCAQHSTAQHSTAVAVAQRARAVMYVQRQGQVQGRRQAGGELERSSALAGCCCWGKAELEAELLNAWCQQAARPPRKPALRWARCQTTQPWPLKNAFPGIHICAYTSPSPQPIPPRPHSGGSASGSALACARSAESWLRPSALPILERVPPPPQCVRLNCRTRSRLSVHSLLPIVTPPPALAPPTQTHA